MSKVLVIGIGGAGAEAVHKMTSSPDFNGDFISKSHKT